MRVGGHNDADIEAKSGQSGTLSAFKIEQRGATMERTMKQFGIRVTKTELISFGVTGERAISAHFRIKPLDGGRTLSYKGRASGTEFINRCERLKLESIIIESSESTSATLEMWKEEVVRQALNQVVL